MKCHKLKCNIYSLTGQAPKLYAYRLVKRSLGTELASDKDVFFYCTAITTPFNDTPNAKCAYGTDNPHVSLSWNEDTNADIYFLMRAEDGGNPAFTEIYRGRETEYKDRGAEDGTKYLYRLDKKKGLERVIGSAYAYVFFDEGTNDLLGNSERENALDLLGTARGCVYDISFTHPNKTIKARDWYKVTIPAGYTAKFEFSQQQPVKSTSGAESDVRWFVVGIDNDPKVIKAGEEITIKNDGAVQKEFVFYLETKNGEWKPSGFMVTYTLKFNGIV